MYAQQADCTNVVGHPSIFHERRYEHELSSWVDECAVVTAVTWTVPSKKMTDSELDALIAMLYGLNWRVSDEGSIELEPGITFASSGDLIYVNGKGNICSKRQDGFSMEYDVDILKATRGGF